MRRILIANSKLYKSYAETLRWIDETSEHCERLSGTIDLMLCPDMVSLATVVARLSPSVAVVAQSCSAYDHEPQTGAITARSLAEAGCRGVLIGHSEERVRMPYLVGSYATVCALVVAQGMTPICCIGEAERVRPLEALQEMYRQLEGFALSAVPSDRAIIIAYEPVWAVAADVVIDSAHVAAMCDGLLWWKQQVIPHHAVRIVYGGNITEHNAPEIASAAAIDGFLLGRSSLSMQTVENIVYSSWAETRSP